MKNFGLLILGFLLGGLVIYFFGLKPVKGDPIVQNPRSPKGLITSKEALALDKAYNLKHRIINDSLFKKSENGGDSRSAWWSIKDIQDYINYAENQAGKLGYTMDGLRLYMGSYPDSREQTGLTTMFFVPTGYKNTSDGSMFPLQGGDISHDIEDADGLNRAGQGDPPSASYPQ